MHLSIYHIYSFLFLILFFIIFNTPNWLRIHLIKRLPSKNISYNPLKYIEFSRLYPLKKILYILLALFFLYGMFRSLYIIFIIKDTRNEFIWITLTFFILALFTWIKAIRYIKVCYHSVPILNKILSKQELEELFKEEIFEIYPIQGSLLKKYLPILVSKNWVYIDGELISKKLAIQTALLHSGTGNHNGLWPLITYINGKLIQIKYNISGYFASAESQEYQKILNQIAPCLDAPVYSIKENEAIKKAYEQILSNFSSEKDRLWYLLTHDTNMIKQTILKEHIN